MSSSLDHPDPGNARPSWPVTVLVAVLALAGLFALGGGVFWYKMRSAARQDELRVLEKMRMKAADMEIRAIREQLRKAEQDKAAAAEPKPAQGQP